MIQSGVGVGMLTHGIGFLGKIWFQELFYLSFIFSSDV